MESKTIRMLAACVLLLSACTSTGARYGMVQRDGGWYSPAVDGRGDYYASQLDYYEARDWPWDLQLGITPFSGYCPARFRYCTSLYADPFYSPLWMSYFY